MDLPLTCPLEAGWQLVRTIRLPRMLADGRPLGGFSAAAYQPKQDRLWLLSDAPIGHLVPWGGAWPHGSRAGGTRCGPARECC